MAVNYFREIVLIGSSKRGKEKVSLNCSAGAGAGEEDEIR